MHLHSVLPDYGGNAELALPTIIVSGALFILVAIGLAVAYMRRRRKK